jgi:predicted nucleic acid-binding protein
MIDYNKVFIDTAPFIYYIEKDINNPKYHENVKSFFRAGYNLDKKFTTSVITVAEYYVFPYRNGKYEYINSFEHLVKTMDMEIIAINQIIAKKAAQIRAEYKGFKAMDALQLAVAITSGCDLFVTNDKQLKQFADIRCITVTDL